MRVLVTGGTGFTGTHLVRRLLARGHRVTALDRQPGLCGDELREEGAELVLGSVTDRGLVDRVVEGHHVVHHLAAAFRKVNLPRDAYRAVNVDGTRHVLEAARRHGVRKVVYCSTQGVHGHVDEPPGDEDTPIEPEDYYQHTKYAGELALREVCKDGPEFTIIRPTAIYGPGDPGR